MKILALTLMLSAALLGAGCASFSTVTVESPQGKVARVTDIVAAVCQTHGYRLSQSRGPIRGYNRFSSDPKNELIRAWEKTADYPTIYEFWRDGRFVVLIDTGNHLSRQIGEELKKKLREADPSLDVQVEDQSYVSFA